jgi:CheY-like chemotaxis protein
MAGETILVVDDNPVNSKLLRVLLASEGYDVRVAGNGRELVRVLAGFSPRLILMDLQLPGSDGLELTRALRRDPAMRDVIIVAITAYATPSDAERAAQSGCDGFLAKPIDTRALPRVIARYLAETRREVVGP